MLFETVLLMCLALIRVESLSMLRHQSRFTFPGDADAGQPNSDGLLERQGLPVFPPQQTLGFPAGNPQNFIVTPPANNVNQTCICVPTGTCNTTTGAAPSDGTGLLDFRIVTAANNAVPPPIITTPTVCGTGLMVCCLPGPYQCGARYPPVANSPVPTDGQAAYGAYPWQAALLGSGDVYVASGVLINANNVLTVAHSVQAYVTNPGTLKVRMGEWNAAATNEPIAAQDFTVMRVTSHPNFNNQNLKNDVAVLRLTTNVPLGQTPTIATVCLPSVAFTGSRCWVSGWGRNAFSGGSFQSIMKHVDLPILQSSQCQTQLAATRLTSNFVFDTNSFICAGGEMSKDACTGDGGAPLVCQLGTQWFVAGLVAWGIGCGTSNVPGVYVNIQTYLPWIQTVV